MSYSRGERFVLWATSKVPRWLLEQPERILVNVACLVVGITTVLPPPDNHPLSEFPFAGRWMLGSLLIVGAVVSLIGTSRINRTADRVGALTLMGGSFFMSLLLFSEAGLRAMLTGSIFATIFIAKGIRFLRSTAVRIQVRHYLLEQIKKAQS